MTVRSIGILGVIASFVVLTFAVCNPSGFSTSEPSTTPPPSAIVLPPTSTALPSATPTLTATAIPSPFEEGFLLIENVEDPASIREMSLKGHVFALEIAATPAERARGLMNRESLAQDSGMLFVFLTESPLNFWMKNTLIPLDILYMDSAGVVVDIQTMTPQPGVSDSELREYPSAAPAQYALEINAGLAESLGFAVEDQAYFR